jgi:hypothetical protein
VRHPDCRKCGNVIVQATTLALVALCPFDVRVGRLAFNLFLPPRYISDPWLFGSDMGQTERRVSEIRRTIFVIELRLTVHP